MALLLLPSGTTSPLATASGPHPSALPSYYLLHLPVFYALTFAYVQAFPLQLSHTAKGPTGWFLNLLPGIAGFLPFEKSVATEMKFLLPEPSETQSWGSTKHVGG